MEHLCLLTILSGVIAVLAFLTWHKTRNLAFPLGLGFLYYWSLHGAWAIITDKRGGVSGTHYYYLEGKMFTLQLNDTYYWALAFYGMFVVIVGLTVLIAAKPASPDSETRTRSPLIISHTVISLMAVSACLLSFAIILPSLATAQALNVAAYSFKGGDRADLPALFVLYLELNRVALLGSAIGLTIVASGKNAKYMTGRGAPWTAPTYIVILCAMIVQAVLMGDKGQIFFTTVCSILFYMANTTRPKYIPLTALGIVGLLSLGVMDMLRGIPLPLLLKTVTTLSPSEWADTAQLVSSSDEAFGAHFSMYGALDYRLAPTLGSSFTSLAASVVPRAFWEDRPDDIYEYYADGVHAAPGQGYAIHHATGWYLNFGIPGIVLGAIVLGTIWSACYNGFRRPSDLRARWTQIVLLISPWAFTANLPMLVRAGPEGYKGVCIDVFLIPTLVLWVASFDWRLLFVDRSRISVREIAT